MAIKYEDSLAAKNPDLAAQWDYEANKGLIDNKGNDISTPDKVMSGARHIVGWKMPYDDPKTGKHYEFKWQAAVRDRNKGTNCPYLSGKAVWPGFNDLATIDPDLAAQWDYEANKGLIDSNGNDISTPDKVTPGSRHKVGWKLPYDDPKTGKHYEFKWQAAVGGRNAHGSDCPYLSGKAVWPGFNDLATIDPELAAQWDYEANRGLIDKNGNDISTPDKVTTGAHHIVGWKMPYDDPKTGKHYEFKWQAAVGGRNAHGSDCPYLSGKAVWPGFNDLATIDPDLAAQWDYEANKGLIDSNGNDISTPDKVTPGSRHKVGWKLPYDDPKTGKHYEFKWQAAVRNRNAGWGCPYLSGQAVWSGFNDLATINPELAAQWDYEANKGLTDNNGNDISTPDKVTASASYKVGWKMPYDDPKTGKHYEFKWQAPVFNRNAGWGCPYLSGKAVLPGFNDLATINPDLAAQWDYEANRGLIDKNGNDISTPDKVTASASYKVGWRMPYDDPETGKHYEFKWQAAIHNRNAGSESAVCPYIPPSCSKAESQVYMWLMDNNIDFVREQSYVGENGNRRFDIYLPQYNAAIEIDGRQHFEDVWDGKAPVSFDDLRVGDNERNEYCEKNGITLLRLPDIAFRKGKKSGTYPYDKIMSTFFGKDGSKFGTVRDSVIKFYDKQADNTYGDLARKMNAGELKSTNYAHMVRIDNSYAAGIENTQDAKSLMDSLWQEHVTQFGKDAYDKYCSIYGKANNTLNNGKRRVDRIAAADALVNDINSAFYEEIDFQK